jgi:hypothetical protein
VGAAFRLNTLYGRDAWESVSQLTLTPIFLYSVVGREPLSGRPFMERNF